MVNVAKWILSTVLLSSLMLGLAQLLFFGALPLSLALRERYEINDDWSGFSFPIGAIAGLILGIRFRDRKWLQVFAGFMLIFSVCTITLLATPLNAPDTTPEGMNRLPTGLGNMLREFVLQTVLITGGIVFAVSVFTNAILSLLARRQSRRELSTEFIETDRV